MNDTTNIEYSQRLTTIQEKWWKKNLIYLNPYKYNLSFICKGKVLEIGCGIGRVLNFFPNRCVGVDHNINSIQICKEKGLQAFTNDDFLKLNTHEQYDTLLLSHILEHMSLEEADKIIKEYLPFIKKNGKIILITPQEKGFDSDPTHIHYMSKPELTHLAKNNNIKMNLFYSFPFPSFFGKYFIYNENIFIGIKI